MINSTTTTGGAGVVVEQPGNGKASMNGNYDSADGKLGSLLQNHIQRPASQTTSVKAEPGSNMGSIASTLFFILAKIKKRIPSTLFHFL